jgi:alcohol dehydrogenase
VIAVPTTAGTGSECQPHAVISDDETGAKVAFATSQSLPAVALLDPVLTLSQPWRVAMDSARDAIVHAVEVWVTRARNPLSSMLAGEAFTLLTRNVPEVVSAPDNLAARGAVQLGAAWAGLGIAHSMLGAAHAAGNPLTASHHISHGAAVASMLPPVIRFNSRDGAVRAQYAALASRAGIAAEGGGRVGGDETLVAALLGRLDSLWSLTGSPRDLSSYGVRARDIGDLAEAAARQWTGTFNPRPVTADTFRALYAEVLGPAR